MQLQFRPLGITQVLAQGWQMWMNDFALAFVLALAVHTINISITVVDARDIANIGQIEYIVFCRRPYIGLVFRFQLLCSAQAVLSHPTRFGTGMITSVLNSLIFPFKQISQSASCSCSSRSRHFPILLDFSLSSHPKSANMRNISKTSSSAL
ncbi:hypothetical protein K432DRAFT_115018 [Lepidopterella palustris CBS 459.81]|uniref:Uncharacterized protein n=1 Tax=Lepidopterella palustris CBS 459.81 TaxID=1314670 RepID=A0A8E2JCR7_9PEZI|nr:hypothetical protein K432DRAFT_115018 [Lepidopterella palustris CBS 459.81]